MICLGYVPCVRVWCKLDADHILSHHPGLRAQGSPGGCVFALFLPILFVSSTCSDVSTFPCAACTLPSFAGIIACLFSLLEIHCGCALGVWLANPYLSRIAMMMKRTTFVVLNVSICIEGSRGETFCTLTVICAAGVFSSLLPSLRVSSFCPYPVLILNVYEILRAGNGRV